jgi:hypothetical protein
MKDLEIKNAADHAVSWAWNHRKGLLLGLVAGFAMAAVYRLERKKKKNEISTKPNQLNLTMERYVFDINTDQGTKQAVVESGGECFAVTLDGTYIGNMWREEELGLEWTTRDTALEEYVPDIASALAEAFSRQGYPSLLRGAYPEIQSTEWKSSETLEVVISRDIDLEVFTAFLKDEVLNLVDFEEHLDLIVKKADNPCFVVIGIN